MSWKTINRNEPVMTGDTEPVLSAAVRDKICSFFDRYDTRRAVLLPALHIVQDALGYIPLQAMVEVAELLEIHPSNVMDTISFYTHFWTQPRGKKVITVCRSVTCEVMGGRAILDELKNRLGIGEHETTSCGKYSLVTEECVAGCDYGPCMLINEKLHRRVRVEDVAGILDDPHNDRIDVERSDLFDAPAGTTSVSLERGKGEAGAVESVLESTSDVQEMYDAD